jgi:DNA gyrase subunit A
MFATRSGDVRRNKLSDFVDGQPRRQDRDEAGRGRPDRRRRPLHRRGRRPADDGAGPLHPLPADEVRVFKGRDSTGVRGVRLQAGDEVISMAVLGRVDATPEERAAYVKHANAMRKALAGAEGEDEARRRRGRR